MSTNTEDSTVPPIATMPVPQTPVAPEKTPLICATCHSTIADDEKRLTCTSKRCGKVTCADCVKLMLRVMFAQPALNYPLKCGTCRTRFHDTQIDQVIDTKEHYEQYIACVLPLHWADDCLQENEQLAKCPFCPYLEIHTTDACSLDFLSCQNPSCCRRSCLTCLHAIGEDEDESAHRTQCIELRSYKDLIDQAIETGSKQRCPHCQLAGVKDSGCTHMTCQRCGLCWCYLCGMKEDECLVDDDAEQSLAAHNQNWERHEGRCPMSLVSIAELDDRWPDDDEQCLEYFHHYRTLCELYEVLKIVGEEKLDELNSNYDLINATGYTIEEIKDYQNRSLINYSTRDDDDE